MSGEICKCCGQTLPPKFTKAGELHPEIQRICDLVFQSGPQGIRSDRLFDLMYENHPEGGPSWQKKTMATRIYWINRRHLRKHGWEIRGTRATGTYGENGYYRMLSNNVV